MLQKTLCAEDAGQEGKEQSVSGSRPVGDVVPETRGQQGSWREENPFEITCGARTVVSGGEERGLNYLFRPHNKMFTDFPS